MSKYVMRLDDAASKRDMDKWARIERMLNKYNIKPLVGVIPFCQDKSMEHYLPDEKFWEKVKAWVEKGWTIAMHGYNHVCDSECGGINPVNMVSEFAGKPLEIQVEKIRKSADIFRENDIEPEVFIAPSHTFDNNTFVALKENSKVRFISDTVAWNAYSYKGFTFIPQQSGMCRKLPFSIVTFCYHPNTMNEEQFMELEKFLEKNAKRFISFPKKEAKRRRNIFEEGLQKLYLKIR